MATGKRYFWFKLRKDFMSGDAVDYLMAQPNGAQFVVLYEMLVLACINSGGKLQSTIGNMVSPFDTARIQRECRFFDLATVETGLALFKQLGMVYQDAEGGLSIEGFDDLVSTETDYAAQKRKQRKGADIVHSKGVDIVHTDKEYRYKSNSNSKMSHSDSHIDNSCSIPKIEEVTDYMTVCAIEMGKAIDPDKEAKSFYDYNETNGWCIKERPIRDWRPVARRWLEQTKQFQKDNATDEDKPSGPFF